MPVYEYECSIHQTFEVQQSIKDEPLIICPHCKEEGLEVPLKKLISTTSFILNGGGWSDNGYNK